MSIQYVHGPKSSRVFFRHGADGYIARLGSCGKEFKVYVYDAECIGSMRYVASVPAFDITADDAEVACTRSHALLRNEQKFVSAVETIVDSVLTTLKIDPGSTRARAKATVEAAKKFRETNPEREALALPAPKQIKVPV